MSACITLVLTLPLLTAEPPKLPKELVGTWALTRSENNGEVTMPDGGAAKTRLTFTASGKSVFTIGDNKVEFTATVDTTVKPALIDAMLGGPDNKQTVEGIWKVEGHTLTLCFCPPDKKKERPTEFQAGAGTGFIQLTFTRDNE